MNWRGGLKTAQGIFWFAMAGILGWPFAAALCAPYVIEEFVLMLFSDQASRFDFFMRIIRGVVSAVLLLVRFPAFLSSVSNCSFTLLLTRT